MQSKHNDFIELLQSASSTLFKVKLNLPTETRLIGILDITGDGTFTTFRKKEHLFRKLNALGINQELLSSKDISFKWILIEYDGSKLVTSRSYFLNKGKVLCFGNKGFEKQVFLPISEFGLDKAREYEAKKIIQSDLFNEVA